jgi:hypothetical protein
MSYLNCPNCGTTVFDRNPLAPRRRCTRCAAHRVQVELQRMPALRGGAAASVLGGAPPARPNPGESESGGRPATPPAA